VGPKKKTSVGLPLFNPLWTISSAEMASSEPVFLNAYWAPELTPKKEFRFSLAGRSDNPIPPRFLAPKDFLKIPAQVSNEK
jgi:hypothetical protein